MKDIIFCILVGKTSEQMLSMHGQYFVQKRSYETSTKFRCQSATKVEVSQHAQIQYDLKARTGSTYVTYRSTFTPLTTDPHTENNAARYKMSQALPELTWKIMTVNPAGECLVLVTTLENQKKACQLIISKSKAEAHDLTVCNTVYEENCKEPSITLYQDDCE
uniref:Lipocalin/cytosolic fatty-acid binding domain-containing protein n=1 Tax=Amblyomma maculatum TaxID=34609 RepID=G3MTR1_AMBMU